jgi:hypothetical protein
VIIVNSIFLFMITSDAVLLDLSINRSLRI